MSSSLARVLNLRWTNPIPELLGNTQLPIAMGISIIVLVIIALLMTRQLLDYTHISGNIMMIMTIVISYGIVLLFCWALLIG